MLDELSNYFLLTSISESLNFYRILKEFSEKKQENKLFHNKANNKDTFFIFWRGRGGVKQFLEVY